MEPLGATVLALGHFPHPNRRLLKLYFTFTTVVLLLPAGISRGPAAILEAERFVEIPDDNPFWVLDILAAGTTSRLGVRVNVALTHTGDLDLHNCMLHDPARVIPHLIDGEVFKATESTTHSRRESALFAFQDRETQPIQAINWTVLGEREEIDTTPLPNRIPVHPPPHLGVVVSIAR